MHRVGGALAAAMGLAFWALPGCTVFLDFDGEIVDAAPEPDVALPDADPLAPDAPPDPTTIFEPNNTQAEATVVEVNMMYGPLAVAPIGDKDFFRFTLAEAKDVVIDVKFMNSGGDLDLRLYDAATMMLVMPGGQSQGADDDEQIVRTMAMNGQLGPGDYILEVYGFMDGQQNLSYTLLIGVP